MKTRTGYLLKRGKTFYACWAVAGKKFRQSTHTADRRQAMTKLAEIMEPFLIEDEVRRCRASGPVSKALRLS